MGRSDAYVLSNDRLRLLVLMLFGLKGSLISDSLSLPIKSDSSSSSAAIKLRSNGLDANRFSSVVMDGESDTSKLLQSESETKSRMRSAGLPNNEEEEAFLATTISRVLA